MSTFKPDTDNQAFQDALSIIRDTNYSLFLTGRAGTGKSTFLRYVRENVDKKMVVLAPTGIAAINVQGMTIHSFFKLPTRPLMPNDKGIRSFAKDTRTYKIIQEADTFVIDEISMVRADLLDAIDTSLRKNTGRYKEPFGGKQMLFIGDLYQLEPVMRTNTGEFDMLKQVYQSFFFFDAVCLQQMPLINIELTKVYRQKEWSFVQLLDRVRTTKVTAADIKQLNQRVSPSESQDGDIILCSTNKGAQKINDQRLLALPGEIMRFSGSTEGDFPDRLYPTDLELELKEGAQVMFIRNDPEGQFVNGSIGTVSSLSDEAVLVTLQSGLEVTVHQHTWENNAYSYDESEKQIVQEVLGEFKQLPLKLAWAITIHKSQGLTFDKVHVDLGRGAFAGGQVYVALSRCTSFEGLTLKHGIRPHDIFVHQRVKEYACLFSDSEDVRRKVVSYQKQLFPSR